MKIANTLLPFMLLAWTTVAGCSFPSRADVTCPNGHSKLTNIPVVYMNDLGRMDKKIQQSVQEYKFFLSYDKKSSNSPTTITVCTTCGFAYHREPKGYWEKDGRSFEEFRNPFPAVFQRVAKIRGKTRPELKQRVKGDHVIYEEMYFVDGLDLKEIRESILEALKSADVQVHEKQVKGTALNEYLFTKQNFAYKLTFQTWYSGQWAVVLKREVSRR